MNLLDGSILVEILKDIRHFSMYTFIIVGWHSLLLTYSILPYTCVTCARKLILFFHREEKMAQIEKNCGKHYFMTLERTIDTLYSCVLGGGTGFVKSYIYFQNSNRCSSLLLNKSHEWSQLFTAFLIEFTHDFII